MPQPKRRPSPARSPLPEIRVGKFRKATRMLDALVRDNTAAFASAGADYRATHRDNSTRPLTYDELGALARGLETDLDGARAQVQAAGLQAHDHPQPQELLFAGITGAAPALLDGALRLTALVEMPHDEFKVLHQEGRLDMALDQAVAAMDDATLDEQRHRAAAAWEHLSQALGYQPGKASSLIARTIWQAIRQGMDQLTQHYSSSTASLTPTGGPEPTSSTPPAG